MADEGDASAAWGSAIEAKEPPSDPIKDALKKEAQIRCAGAVRVGLRESLSADSARSKGHCRSAGEPEGSVVTTMRYEEEILIV